MRTVITGEAVALELPAASLITRGASLLIDLIIYWASFVMLLGVAGAYGAGNPMNEAWLAALAVGGMVFCLVVVPVTVETLTRGRSVGKLVFGVRVVRDDGGSIRLRHSVLRWLVGYLEIHLTLGLMPLLTAMFTARGKRMGDVLAGTYGVRVRQQRLRPMMLPVPPAMASWTQIADIGRIPDTTAARAARLLRVIEQGGRARNMPALTAASDGLADQIVQYVSPTPPTNSSVEFLTAVIAERRNREYQRLVRAQQKQMQRSERLHSLPYAAS